MPKKTIMVVDDEPTFLKVVEDILEPESYTVIQVSGGQEALDKLKKIKPDLILLDIMMPGIDGWEVCEIVKADKETEKIPIIFVTAKSDPESRSAGSVNAMDYITKPFEYKDFIKKVKKAIDE